MNAVVSFLYLASSLAAEPAPNPSLAVSTAWLGEHLADAGLTVIAVGKNSARYDEGHIPGAVFLPWSAVAVSREGGENDLPTMESLTATFTALGIGNEGRIVLYGESRNLMAARAFMALDYLGHGDRCALLDGGLEAWLAEGRPTMTTAAEPGSRPFTPHLQADVVVDTRLVIDASWAATNVPGSTTVLMDARPEAQFTGQEAGGGVTRPGHIPGAVHVYWETLFADETQPKLPPLAELQQRFAAAGVEPGDTVIHYCRTGGQASYTYYVSRLLGYRSVLYDGSYLEWSRAEGTPVVK